ncbi:hypothetical protein BY996DRAFT_6686503 [Phakopsora pachyrhizi]|uniref:Vacuole protein n=1 Tax=Phakopsora pachyrhizi TaxID=170000 RepID=A0AAV0B1H1_PHAPC|nr:hypothetical protein BY996DRAFT_6686503 [Phakopsora pachyrhizi]CAH7675380.1 hypothetical protein PPACK8108_LOCUS10377 [Phakopsora pachyrhizi]
MCCSGARWKREEVPDHKWDFVDVREFHSSSCMSYLQYCFLYVLVIKSVLVYCSDVYTMVLLLASNHWAGSILQNSGGSSAVNVPFSIGKWIFFGCIIFSFLLLLWEAKKSKAIIRSRDISYAFTNVMANNYYSMKSYDHFCFFSQINNSKKKKDDFAFFVFFTFKGWKRLLLADAPRQVINGLTLYSFAKSVNFTTDISKWYGGSFAKASVLLSMGFTVVIWIGSFILLLAAALMYVPLLCYIQGNLKEYCCHKVDKRIAELMKRKNRKRLAKEAALMRKEAMGDYSHLKDKKGQFKAAPLPQPTLPKIGFEDLMSDSKSERGGAPSIRGGIPRNGPHAYPPPLGIYAGSAVGSGLGFNPSERWGNGSAYGPEKPGYAESVASTDRFISHQATTMAHMYGGSNGVRVDGRQYGQHPLATGHPATLDASQLSLNRAPSYSSQDHYQHTDEKYSAAPYANGGGGGQHNYAGGDTGTFYSEQAPAQKYPSNYQTSDYAQDRSKVGGEPNSQRETTFSQPYTSYSQDHPQPSDFADHYHEGDFGGDLTSEYRDQYTHLGNEQFSPDRNNQTMLPHQSNGPRNNNFNSQNHR